MFHEASHEGAMIICIAAAAHVSFVSPCEAGGNACAAFPRRRRLHCRRICVCVCPAQDNRESHAADSVCGNLIGFELAIMLISVCGLISPHISYVDYSSLLFASKTTEKLQTMRKRDKLRVMVAEINVRSGMIYI